MFPERQETCCVLRIFYLRAYGKPLPTCDTILRFRRAGRAICLVRQPISTACNSAAILGPNAKKKR